MPARDGILKTGQRQSVRALRHIDGFAGVPVKHIQRIALHFLNVKDRFQKAAFHIRLDHADDRAVVQHRADDGKDVAAFGRRLLACICVRR